MKESPDEENDKINSTTNLENEKFQKSLEPCNVCSESIEKAKEVYIDKNITCYEENGFHVVKDICVDHGEIINELPCNPIIVNGDKHDDMSNVDTSPLEDKIKVKVFVQDNIALQINGEDKLDSVEDSVTVLEPADNGVNEAGQQHSENAGSEANGPSVIYIPKEIKTEKNPISNPDIMKPTTVSGPDELELNPHDLAAVGRGGGESSFSMAAVSGLITYSGPVTANGNISHRSDGSNSSVRSFAFPILPNEWNSSPIRMAKPDPKHSQKHRGWRQAFICCGF